jgi:hypothetical protein
MWARGISDFDDKEILAYRVKIFTVLIYEHFQVFGFSSTMGVLELKKIYFSEKNIKIARALRLTRFC